MNNNLAAIAAENVKHICARRKLSQQELAKASGVHFTTINRIFRGHIQPTLPVCERLAIALEIPASKLFSRKA